MGFLPVLIFVLVAIPVLVIAYRAVGRSKAVGEHPPGEDAATRERTEHEFAEAEAYEEQWRAEQRKHPKDSIL